MKKKPECHLENLDSTEPSTQTVVADPLDDDGDICTPKSEPSTDDDQPLD